MHSIISPHQEPEEVFLPLSPKRYADFYSIEMDSFYKDIQFYKNNIAADAKVLELGCGTGRISHNLAQSGRKVTGLDLSIDMLQRAKSRIQTDVHYVCMDMCQIGFVSQFDHIIIPYNTLNLLCHKSAIICCLQEARRLLKPRGTLLFQVHIPQIPETEKHEKIFQFQMLTLPDNRGKLIKESIRSFAPETESFYLNERYRLRTTGSNAEKKDFQHTIQLADFSFAQWVQIVQDSGLRPLSLFSDYNNRPFDSTSDVLLLAITSK